MSATDSPIQSTQSTLLAGPLLPYTRNVRIFLNNSEALVCRWSAVWYQPFVQNTADRVVLLY